MHSYCLRSRVTCFRGSQLHIHDPSRGSIITAAAVGGDGAAVYLGTSSGRVEHHRITVASDGRSARLALVATRPAGKKVLPSGSLGRQTAVCSLLLPGVLC